MDHGLHLKFPEQWTKDTNHTIIATCLGLGQKMQITQPQTLRRTEQEMQLPTQVPSAANRPLPHRKQINQPRETDASTLSDTNISTRPRIRRPETTEEGVFAGLTTRSAAKRRQAAK